MKDKNILFITYDLSGYYKAIKNELKTHYYNVEYYNIASLKKYKYKHIFEKGFAAIYKVASKKKIKNYYQLQPIIDKTSSKTYDKIIIIRPDLFFDSQLKALKSRTDHFIAYYHDSISNIERKKEVVHFFDKAYSYEKKDVKDYQLEFLPNFIYLDDEPVIETPIYDAFTIMSDDYRLSTLEKLGRYLQKSNINYKFLVQSDKKTVSAQVTFVKERKSNKQVLNYLKKTKVIVDIHKYGIQDGLTFRVFESLYFEKKLITTNADIKTYDFYNPNNILVIDPNNAINIPEDFFSTPYEKVPSEIYQKYHYTNWLKTILS
ncbi:hypothetical protein JJL45_13250 [Tamlana sp. s12]|uniref:hypothetical protein n=1 Tax=Tamlana sp. s12 TaxID=1630406 RepID=UPI0007FFDE6C|nr:hypothetical protein [Tamlana sp. s12]OBQ56498.1 hypothetical protein VQ01_03855 [Tamlana sp. s12]QQY81876.1 hypothetical protein JJL45_13250 [Tamlana sp. s12]